MLLVALHGQGGLHHRGVQHELRVDQHLRGQVNQQQLVLGEALDQLPEQRRALLGVRPVVLLHQLEFFGCEVLEVLALGAVQDGVLLLTHAQLLHQLGQGHPTGLGVLGAGHGGGAAPHRGLDTEAPLQDHGVETGHVVTDGHLGVPVQRVQRLADRRLAEEHVGRAVFGLDRQADDLGLRRHDVLRRRHLA